MEIKCVLICRSNGTNANVRMEHLSEEGLERRIRIREKTNKIMKRKTKPFIKNADHFKPNYLENVFKLKMILYKFLVLPS